MFVTFHPPFRLLHPSYPPCPSTCPESLTPQHPAGTQVLLPWSSDDGLGENRVGPAGGAPSLFCWHQTLCVLCPPSPAASPPSVPTSAWFPFPRFPALCLAGSEGETQAGVRRSFLDRFPIRKYSQGTREAEASGCSRPAWSIE